MDASTHIAGMIGPLLVVNSVGVLLGGKSYRAMAEEFLNSRALVYLSGFMTLLIGLGIVNAWKPGFPVVLTVIGWLFAVGGAIRMLFPDRVMAMGMAMLDKRPWLIAVSAIAQLLIGVGITLASRLL